MLRFPKFLRWLGLVTLAWATIAQSEWWFWVLGGALILLTFILLLRDLVRRAIDHYSQHLRPVVAWLRDLRKLPRVVLDSLQRLFLSGNPRYVVLRFAALLALVGAGLIVVGTIWGFWWGWLYGLITGPVGLYLILGGLVTIPQQEILILELFGKFLEVLGPGLHYVPPWPFRLPRRSGFQIFRVRTFVPTWLREMPLFPSTINIDFKGGGTARPVDLKLWYRPDFPKFGKSRWSKLMESVRRIIYEVEDYESYLRENGEWGFRALLNDMSVEEALAAMATRHVEWWGLVREKFPGLPKDLRGKGMLVEKITMTDFDWSNVVVGIRDRVFESDRGIIIAANLAKAAAHTAEQKARESGLVYGEVVRLLTAKDLPYNFSKAEAMDIADKTVNFFKSADAKTLNDIRFTLGGERTMDFFADLFDKFISKK